MCYEFSAIYSKFLSALDINHEIKFNNSVNKVAEPYGHKHSYVTFRIGDYLISADPTRTIARSDMSRLKFGMAPQYFHLKNVNESTRDTFITSLNKMTELVQNIYEPSSKQDMDFLSALNTYDQLSSTIRATSTPEKFNLIVGLIGQCNQSPMDILSYTYFLNDAILDIKEQSHFNISHVRHTPIIDGNLQTDIAELGLVLSMGNSIMNPEAEDLIQETENSPELMLSDPKGYVRAYYSSSTGLQPLSDGQMHAMFESGEFSYIRPMAMPIPGGPISSTQYVLNTEQ